ncbi:MAG: hypothetical protein CMP81_23660 [Fulvimarina sp.]|nr:hypothetical protein [Fulvimarina sp.]
MSLTIGSGSTTTTVLSSDSTGSGNNDVAAIKEKLASAQKAASDAEAAGDTEEATTQQALVSKYTADLARAQKAAESSGASAASASSGAPAASRSSESEAGNPYKPTARLDVTTLAAGDESEAASSRAGTQIGASAEAERAEKEYKANMPLGAEQPAP